MEQKKIDWSFAHPKTYENITEEQVIEFVETIDWNRVPGNIFFTKKILEFADDFPEIIKEIIKRISSKDYFIWEQKEINAKYIKKLIEDGFDVHWKDDYLLRCASESGNTEVVKILLDAGANIHAKKEYALIWASFNDHIEILKLLLEAGADVHADNDNALKNASFYGNIEVVKLLLEAGADVQNEDALKLAYVNGHTEVVDLLRKNGSRY